MHPQRQMVKVDWLKACLAAAGPTLEDGLKHERRLWKCQAGRG